MNSDLPPAAQMMDMLFGFALSRSISVAAQFGLADQLKDGPKSADELAAATGLHARSLYRMMRALAGAGVFAEDGERRFSLTPLSDVLRSDAPESLRAFASFIANDVNFTTWAKLPYSIQTGERGFDHTYGAFYFDWIVQNPAEGKIFNDAMTSMSLGSGQAVVAGYDFTGIRKLVDVGGGHGMLLAAILQKYPDLQGVLFDAAPVISQANAVLEAAGVAERCELVSGNFFQSVPAGGDAYIMKHIVHDWSDDECVTFLSHCREGMTPGGKMLVVEMVLPEPNVPAPSKFLDLEMLLFMTGCERTESEYRALLERAGFTFSRIVSAPPYSVIEAVKA